MAPVPPSRISPRSQGPRSGPDGALFLHLAGSNLNYRVVAGEHNLNANEGSEQIFSVSKIVVHPYWNSNNVAAG